MSRGLQLRVGGVCIVLSHSVLSLCDPWTVACQAPLCMGFSRPEYWSELPFPPPRDLPHPGMEPESPALQAYSLPSEPPGTPTWGWVFPVNPGKAMLWSAQCQVIPVRTGRCSSASANSIHRANCRNISREGGRWTLELAKWTEEPGARQASA